MRVAGSTTTPQDILRLMHEQVLEDAGRQLRIPSLMIRPIARVPPGPQDGDLIWPMAFWNPRHFPCTVLTLTADIILYAVLIIVIAYIGILLLSFLLTRAAERMPTHRTQIRWSSRLRRSSSMPGPFFLIASTLFKPDVAELIAFFGLFGAILAFGVKDLFSDIVGGFVIIVEKPFQIGDKIMFGGYYGEVTDIGLRSMRIITSTISCLRAELQCFQPVGFQQQCRGDGNAGGNGSLY